MERDYAWITLPTDKFLAYLKEDHIDGIAGKKVLRGSIAKYKKIFLILILLAYTSMDIHTPILTNISKHISLAREEKDHFISLLTYKELPKKTTVLTEGQPCHQLSYIHSGTLRSYCLDKNGKESTIMFAMSDWWLTDMYCFLNESPSMTFIETIEDSQILNLSKDNFDHLFTAIPKFERFFRILMQNAYTREQLRTIENLTLDAEERYAAFMAKYPRIAGKVTQKQIASYLGITPEHLSVIRKNYRHRK